MTRFFGIVKPDRVLWLLVGVALAIYLKSVFLAFISGSPITDDEIDLVGGLQHILIYSRLIHGDARSINVIHDLGYYGQIYKIPYLLAWQLWINIGSVDHAWTFQRIADSLLLTYFTPPELLSPGVVHELIEPFRYLYRHLHLLTSAYFLFLLYIVGQIASRTLPGSSVAAPFAVLLTLATPHITGLSLFDSKDISIALFYSIFTLGLLEAFNLEYPAQVQQASLKRSLFYILPGAILCSLKLILFPVVALTVVATKLLCLRAAPNITISSSLKTQTLQEIPRIVLLAFLSLLFNPYILAQPYPRALEALHLYSNHSNKVEMLFSGRLESAASQSWNTLQYLSQWFIAVTPLPILILSLFTYSILAFSLIDKRLSTPRLVLAPVLLQLFFLPTLAIFNNSNTYDALRHWIFALIANNIVIAVVLSSLFSRFSGRFSAKSAFALTCISLVLVLADSYVLAPYQYAFKNTLHRSTAARSATDGDFWLFSARELLFDLAAQSTSVRTFNGSSWDYSRIWTRDLGLHLEPAGSDVIVFDRGSNLLRSKDYVCDRTVTVQRRYFSGSFLPLLKAGLGCTSTSDLKP